MPPTTDYKSVFQRQQRLAEERWRSAARILDRDQNELQAILDQFSQYPLMIIETGVINKFNSYDISLTKCLELICKENYWTYINIQKTRYDEFQMIVPNTEKTDQLVSSLLLIATPTATRYSENPVHVLFKPRSWTFTFYKEKGEQILKAWMHNVRTDTLAQLMLGFSPNKETEL